MPFTVSVKSAEPRATLDGEMLVVVGTPLLMVNDALSAAVMPVAVACSSYPAPARLILQPAKVSTPFTAAFGFVVHVSAAPGVPVPLVMDRVMFAVELVAVFPYAS